MVAASAGVHLHSVPSVPPSDGGPLRPPGMIGPNAILQMLPVLEEAGGAMLRERLLSAAGIVKIPSGDSMIDEAPAMRLHQALRREMPGRAAAMAADAGRRTGDYILAHRIPKQAQLLLKVLPQTIAARILAQAITKHAWTFAGSGAFTCNGPLSFALADNPVVAGETSDTPLCHWHAAVFARLYSTIIRPGATCVETACCAQGAPACTFEIKLD